MGRRCGPAAAALLALSLVFAFPGSARGDKVDRYIKAEMQRLQIPGLSLAVVRSGKIVKAKGYGLANVELNVAATPQTMYQSGSIGKQFVATLTMMLVEEGRPSLDDPITKYFAGAPDSWKGIAVRHLLTHTAGIPDSLYQKIDTRHDYTEDELVGEIAALPLAFSPGSRWSYSNPGYVLLGVLLHKATGEFWGDLLREKIFVPLGMTTARLMDEAEIVPNRAAGYQLVNGELRSQDWIAPSLNKCADGSLYLSLLDLAKWDAALYSDKLLKRSSLELMWTPVKLNDGRTAPYGFGWMVGTRRGQRLIQHGGGWQGFSAHIARYIHKELTVIIMTNLAGVVPSRMPSTIAGFYDPDLAPLEHTAVPIDAEVLDRYVGEYELAPGVMVDISREGDRMWAQATGQSRVELFAASETEFFVKDAEVEVTFYRDESGNVTHLAVHDESRGNRNAKKIR